MRIEQRDQPTPNQEVQYRYCELRYDGERTLSGVALRYGDVADLGYGRETFDPMAFRDLASADVILNIQHDRSRPIARTRGGGLELVDNATELSIRAVLPDTREATDALTNVRSKIFRGLSIEFVPERVRNDGNMNIIERARLTGIAVVDRPAYKKSKVNPRQKEDIHMNEEQIRQLIEKEIQRQLDSGDKNKGEVRAEDVANTVAKVIAEQVREQVTTALKERDEADEAAKQARQEQADAEKRAAESKTAEEESRAEFEKEAIANAEKRAALITQVKPLLPKDYDVREKSTKEIMVSAVGDAVSDAENRSEDYLQAKIEGLVDLRQKAADGQPASVTDPVNLAARNTHGGVDVNSRMMHNLIQTRMTAAAQVPVSGN